MCKERANVGRINQTLSTGFLFGVQTPAGTWMCPHRQAKSRHAAEAECLRCDVSFAAEAAVVCALADIAAPPLIRDVTPGRMASCSDAPTQFKVPGFAALFAACRYCNASTRGSQSVLARGTLRAITGA
jgi:hypothetical protein